MSRRRWLEIAVALLVVAILIGVLVRETARRTAPPPVELFTVTPARAPALAAGDYSARVAWADDSSAALVLYPVEFEERADLYRIPRGQPGGGERLALVPRLTRAVTPKRAGWLDAGTAWVIVGETYGTVSPGGDLFAVDLASGRALSLWASADSFSTQAVGFEPPRTVRLTVYDRVMTHPRDSTAVLAKDAVERALAELRAARRARG